MAERWESQSHTQQAARTGHGCTHTQTNTQGERTGSKDFVTLSMREPCAAPLPPKALLSSQEFPNGGIQQTLVSLEGWCDSQHWRGVEEIQVVEIVAATLLFGLGTCRKGYPAREQPQEGSEKGWG